MMMPEVGATSSGGGSAGSGGETVPVAPQETDKATPPATLTVIIKDQTGEATYFKVKKTTRMEKLFETYAKRKALPVASFRFLLDGVPLRADDTSATVELEDLDQIDCILDQPLKVEAWTPTPSGAYEELKKRAVDLEQAQSKLERRTLVVMVTSLLVVPFAMWVGAAAGGWW